MNITKYKTLLSIGCQYKTLLTIGCPDIWIYEEKLFPQRGNFSIKYIGKDNYDRTGG